MLNRYDVSVNGKTVAMNSLLPSPSEVQKNASDIVFAFRVNGLSMQREALRVIDGTWFFQGFMNDHSDDEAMDQE